MESRAFGHCYLGLGTEYSPVQDLKLLSGKLKCLRVGVSDISGNILQLGFGLLYNIFSLGSHQ